MDLGQRGKTQTAWHQIDTEEEIASGKGEGMPMQSRHLEKEDVLLLLLLALSDPRRKAKVAGITRIEKMMYLLQKETCFSGRVHEKFDFKPWKFGPFSKEIYEALDLLFSLNLVDIEERELANYVEYTERDALIGTEEDEPIVEKLFSLTPRGRTVAQKFKDSVAENDWAELVSLKRRFERVPLTALIQYVYHKYPETTDKSVLEHLKSR